MNKMIVAVFDTEEKAFEGLSELKNLHENGDISMHATAVLTKDGNGKLSLKESADEGPIGTAVGMLSGILIGMLAGPAGMAVGGSLGMLGGMFYDIDKSGIDAGFVEDVAQSLAGDKVAVIADVEEGWTAPVDIKMEQLDGTVFRRNRYNVEDDQMIKDSEEFHAELDELHEEIKDAKDDAKASIQKQIDKLKAKQTALKEKVKNRRELLASELAVKVDALNKQIKTAKDKNRKKLEKRKADLHADFERRKNKLNAAFHKSTEYVT